MSKYTHLVDRTSPMGGPFVGKCRWCGKENLKMSAALEHCDAAPTAGENVLAALVDPPKPVDIGQRIQQLPDGDLKWSLSQIYIQCGRVVSGDGGPNSTAKALARFVIEELSDLLPTVEALSAIAPGPAGAAPLRESIEHQ